MVVSESIANRVSSSSLGESVVDQNDDKSMLDDPPSQLERCSTRTS